MVTSHVHHLMIGDIKVDVQIRINKRSKSMRLYHSKLTGYSLVLLDKTSLRSGLSFLDKSKSWLLKKRSNDNQDSPLLNSLSFQPLSQVSVFGTPFQLVHHPTIAPLKQIMVEDFTIHVHCQSPDFHGLVLEWLYKQSHRYFQLRSLHYAKLLNVSFKKVTIKEMTSRWGSCSTRGNLSYSWRLCLADPHVADYLCAHEVCHLKEMNHSAKFWAHVHSICPNYITVRQHLKKDGWQLFNYRHD